MWPLSYSSSNWVKCYFFLIIMYLSPSQCLHLAVKQMWPELKYIDNSLSIYPAAYLNYDSNLSSRIKPKNKSLFLQDHNFLPTMEKGLFSYTPLQKDDLQFGRLLLSTSGKLIWFIHFEWSYSSLVRTFIFCPSLKWQVLIIWWCCMGSPWYPVTLVFVDVSLPN